MRIGCRIFLLCATGIVLSAEAAHAHIIMDGELKGREGDQKSAPCEGLARSADPYVFEPGATITLAAIEAIGHDGYFRISFDDDGTDFVDPQSIAPINPDRYGAGKKCLGTADDRCGKSDFCSVSSTGKGARVLWDQLDPHLGTDVSFGQTREWTVKLPNVECDNCTLQVMQVMEDPADGAHGPFDGEGDLYYRCVDIVLKKGVGKTPGTATGPATNDGIECAKAAGPTDEGAHVHGDEEGGCSVSAAGRGAAGFSAVMALVTALLFVRRGAPSGARAKRRRART